MAGYLSPATFQTPNAWKADGALGGFLAGMNQDIGNQIVQREFNQDDVDLAAKKQRLEEAQALMASKKAEADFNEAKAKADKSRIDSGMYSQVQGSNDQTTLANNNAKQIGDLDSIRQKTAPIMIQMQDDLKKFGGQLDPMNPEHVNMWNNYREQLGQYGVNLPAFPAPQDMVKLQNGFQKAQQYVNQQADIALHPERFKAAETLKKEEADYKKATDVARIAADSRNDVANTRADAAREIADARNANALKLATEKQKARDHYKNYFVNRARDIQTGGGVTNANEASDVEQFADIQAAEQLGGDEGMKALTNPAGYEQAKEAKKEQILDGFPGYREFQLKRDVGATSKKAAPASAPNAPAVGTVNKGYRFKGGDPSKKENWEKI